MSTMAMKHPFKSEPSTPSRILRSEEHGRWVDTDVRVYDEDGSLQPVTDDDGVDNGGRGAVKVVACHFSPGRNIVLVSLGSLMHHWSLLVLRHSPRNISVL